MDKQNEFFVVLDSKGNKTDLINKEFLESYISDIKNEAINRQIDQHKLIYQQANGFAQVAARVYNSDIKKPLNNINFNSIAPYITNSTFAIELYLKSIVLKYQPKSFASVKGVHNLRKLYYSLNGKLQNKLQLTFKICLKAQGIDYQHNLDTVINNYANAFKESRYIYEQSEMRFSDLNVFIPLLASLDNSYLNIDCSSK